MMMLVTMTVRMSLVFRPVARSLRAFLYHAVRYGLQIVRPADPGEEVDEGGGEVRTIVTQLGRLVVPREHMMVIVPALAEGADADAVAVGGANGVVVRFHAPNVGRGVHQPSHMQRQRVSEEGGVPRVHGFLVPVVTRYPSGKQKAENRHQDDVKPALPDDNKILLEIAHINRSPFADDIRMLTDQKPTHVRKEETPLRVVRIRVRVREFMMDSVIPHPLINMILESYGLQKHKDNSHRPFRFVRSVSPQSVSACCNTDSSKRSD